jgi:coproporphyrinogen III oxidase-like Fe-S oxidoreductase
MGYAPRKPYQNYGATDAYFKHLDAGERPIEAIEALTPEMELARQFITELRSARVDLRGVREKYGVDVQVVFGDLLRVLGELGLLERQGDEILLSRAAAPSPWWSRASARRSPRPSRWGPPLRARRTSIRRPPAASIPMDRVP